jgi:hypothetical protein
MTIGSSSPSVNFQMRSGTNKSKYCDNTPGSFAFADYTTYEESIDEHTHNKGGRAVTICPSFFTIPNVTRNLPATNDDDAKKTYCEHKESKKVPAFESGGHTLMHDTHLDSFGVAAGYPEEEYKNDPKKDQDFDYKYHGTVDWKGKTDADNARTLKNLRAKNAPKCVGGGGWMEHDAESLTAAATEIYDMATCDDTDIDT